MADNEEQNGVEQEPDEEPSDQEAVEQEPDEEPSEEEGVEQKPAEKPSEEEGVEQKPAEEPSDDDLDGMTAETVSSPEVAEAGILSRYWKLLSALIIISGLIAAVMGYLLLMNRPEPEPPPAVVESVDNYTPLLSEWRVKQIQQRRSKMRIEQRSLRNRHLTTKIEENALDKVSDRSDLIVIANIFNNYVEALAVFFELGRIITNNYLANQAEVRDVFKWELMPKFKYAERRRYQMNSRIKNEQLQPMLNDLDYIAFHDSIAVYSMQAYLREEKKEDFINSLKFGYQAKLMKKDFWKQFSYYLDKYEINFVRNDKIWNRYFGSWDEVQP